MSTFTTTAKPRTLNRVMVRFSGSEMDAKAILRHASLIAAELNAKLYAVHVTTSEEGSRVLDASLRATARIMSLAKSIGAETITLKDDDIAQSLVQFAYANDITHLVQGYPGVRAFYDTLRKSITDMLIESLPDVQIIMV